MRSGKGGGNICSHLPCTQAQFKVFRKCSNLVLMEKRLGMLLFHDLNYGNSSGKEKTWHVSMVSKYADPVGERHTHTNETILCAKDFRKKKNNNKIREVWNCLCLSPQHGFLINALGLQMQVFPMIPRLDCLTGATDIAFILPWLCPSWGGGTSCRLWAGEASMDSSPPCSPLPALRLLPADSSHYSLFRYKLAFLWKWFWTRFLSFLQTTG